MGLGAVFPPLIGLVGVFSRQPFDRVGIVYRPRGDDDLGRIREGSVFHDGAVGTHESQDEGRCSKKDEGGLEGLEDETYQEREDLGCRVRIGERRA